MSGFQNAGWLSRLWSLAAPGDPRTQYVENVQLVNDMRWRGSRERAPWGRLIDVTPAPAAGEHAGFEIRADDPKLSPIVLLHHLRAITSAAGAIVFAVTTPTANLIADRTAASFAFRDSDPDVSLSAFSLSTAVGDLPTSELLPTDVSGTAGWGGILPFGNAHPFAGFWQSGQSLYVFCFVADQTLQIDAAIQGIRA